MRKRDAVNLLVLFILCACRLPARGEEGYHFYSAGRKCELARIEGLWAISSAGGTGLAGKFAKGSCTPVSEWPRHGVAIVRSEETRGGLVQELELPGDAGFVNPVFDYGGGAPLVVTDEFIACFPPQLARSEIDEINSRYGAEIVREIPVPANTFVLRAGGPDELAALKLANTYCGEGIAVFAHPNFIARKSKRFTPNDPYFSSQWHLNNVGQEGAVAKHDVEAPAAWDITRGSTDVVIAIIDDGVDFSHEDLQGDKFHPSAPGYDFYSDDSDPSAEPSNEDFHGTAVVGVAAANGNNGVGVTGVAPGCRVMPIRLVAGETSDEQDAAAIRWAADNGAWIISNSWGPLDGNPFFEGDEINYPLPDIVRAALDHAADNGRGGKGCVIFWAAGNGNEPVSLDGYASYDKVIAVGACNDQGVRSFYSDYGPELDLCAPSDGGETSGIWTTDLMGPDGYNPGGLFCGDQEGNYTCDFGGTSSAAPLAAGVAALLLSREPDLTREEVQQRLQETADRVDFSSGSYDLNGHSINYGFGRVNALSALTGRPRHPVVEISVNPAEPGDGEIVSLSYSVQAGSEAAMNYGDAYLVVVSPAGIPLFLNPFCLVTAEKVSVAPGIAATDMNGSFGPGFFLSGITPGRYTVYGAIVSKDADPYQPGSWIHTPARASFDFSP